jgi:hypothetical protein
MELLLRIFLQLHVTLSFFDPNILLSILFSNIHNLYSSLNVRDQVSHPYKTTGKTIVLCILFLRRLRRAGHVARMREVINMCRILVGNPEAKRPLRRPRNRWENHIKTDLKEMGWERTGHTWPRIGTGGAFL